MPRSSTEVHPPIRADFSLSRGPLAGNKKAGNKQARDAVAVVWTMAGTRGAIISVMGRFFSHHAIGKDFERGLAALQAETERASVATCA